MTMREFAREDCGARMCANIDTMSAVPNNTHHMPEKLWNRSFITSLICLTLLGLVFILLLSTLAEYSIAEFQVTEGVAGFVASIFVFGALFMRLFSGRMILRYGIRLTLILSGLAFFIVSLFYFLPLNLPALLVVRTIHGMAFGVASTALPTIVMDYIPRNRRGEGVGFFSMGYTIATAVGALIGLTVLRNYGAQALFAVSMIFCALTFMLMFALKPILPENLSPSDKEIEADKSSQKLLVPSNDTTIPLGGTSASVNRTQTAQNTSSVSLDGTAMSSSEIEIPLDGTTDRAFSPVNRIETASNGTTVSLDEPADKQPLWGVIEVSVLPISLFIFVIALVYSTIPIFAGSYANTLGIAKVAPYFFLMYSVVVLAGRPYVGRLVDRTSENSAIYPGVVLFGLSVLLLALVHGQVFFLCAAIPLGLGYGSLFFVGQTVAVSSVPHHRIGMANATFYLCADAGLGFGPMVWGSVAHQMGFPTTFLILAGILALCLPYYWLTHGRHVAIRS